MVPETAGGILVDCSHAYPHPDQEVWAGRLSSLPAQAWKAPSHFWLIVLSRPRHLGRGQGWGGDEGGGVGICVLCWLRPGQIYYFVFRMMSMTVLTTHSCCNNSLGTQWLKITYDFSYQEEVRYLLQILRTFLFWGKNLHLPLSFPVLDSLIPLIIDLYHVASVISAFLTLLVLSKNNPV